MAYNPNPGLRQITRARIAAQQAQAQREQAQANAQAQAKVVASISTAMEALAR